MLGLNPRWWVLVIVVLILCGMIVYGEEHGFTLAIGKMNPTDQEQQECYFPIGQHASVNLNPRGDMCVIARTLAGRTGRLVFIPDE